MEEKNALLTGAKKQRLAFTLVELLIVIAIIAILVGFLLPALATARQRALMATCLSNHKQLALAWGLYADDNQDILVNMNNFDNANVPGQTQRPWRYQPATTYYSNTLPVVPPKGAMNNQTYAIFLMQECVKQGAFGPYLKNANVIHCPGDARCRRPVGNGFAYGSVAGVTGLNGQTWNDHPTQPEILTKKTQVIPPSDKLLFVEENDPRDENRGAWVMDVRGAAANNWSGTTILDSPAVFHVNSSSFSWADGHSSSRRWLDGATIAYSASVDPNKYRQPAERGLNGAGRCFSDKGLPVSWQSVASARSFTPL